jgi:Domain of unknown function (DUF4139)
MRRSLRARLLLGPAAIAASVVTASAVHAGELPLTRVVLSSSGLAQFTHYGAVTPGASVDLAVRLDQVDDVLKSLTIYDAAAGIGVVSLPGKVPLAELFRDLPFGPDALASRVELLRALIGTEIEISGPVAAKGRLLRIEDEDVALPNGGGRTTKHRLTLMTGRVNSAMVQAILEDVAELRFSDPQISAQIDRALSGIDANRIKDSRKLSIGFLGDSNRNAALSYVVAAPVWKTSYRLVLPQDGGKARLQGWAVVENLTGGDWRNVELTLVSGNPVALRQPLYSAFFSDRPEIPVTAGVRLTPRVDDAEERAGEDQRGQKSIPVRPQAALLSPAPAPASGAAGLARDRLAQFGTVPAQAMPSMGAAANAAEAEEASTQLLYRFPAKISLGTGQTMMVPFVDREANAKPVWLYQPETAPRHPLAAVQLTNDGEAGLPAGIVTAYDSRSDGSTNFVGDAQLPLLSKGVTKFVTFALDAKTDIKRQDDGPKSTQLGKVVNGVLTTTIHWRRTLSYEIVAPADEDRSIVIEEPRPEGWTLANDAAGVETTPTRYRYTVAAPKGKTTTASLTLERIENASIALTTLAAEDILARVRGLQNESEAFKATVAKLSSIVNDINKAKAQRAQLDAERKKITEDQARIRENLKSVGQGNDLGKRYIDSLKSQEDRLAQIAQQDRDAEADIAAKRKSAEDVARQINL